MKKILFILFVGIMVYGIIAFTPSQTSIRGKILPPDAGLSVWAISNIDSTRGIIAEGGFSIPVKPGIYSLWLDAKEPYKDVQLHDLILTNGQVLDLGDIMLKQ